MSTLEELRNKAINQARGGAAAIGSVYTMPELTELRRMLHDMERGSGGKSDEVESNVLTLVQIHIMNRTPIAEVRAAYAEHERLQELRRESQRRYDEHQRAAFEKVMADELAKAIGKTDHAKSLAKQLFGNLGSGGSK